MLRVTVNGVPRQFPEGQTILQALRSIGIELPALCHDEHHPVNGPEFCRRGQRPSAVPPQLAVM